MAKNTQKWKATFGTVGLNQKTSTLKVALTTPDLPTIDARLRNSQLEVVLVADAHAQDDADGQEVMDVGAPELSGVAEVHGYGVLPNGDVRISLAFSQSAVEAEELSKFIGTSGTLTVKRLGEASVSKGAEAEDKS